MELSTFVEQRGASDPPGRRQESPPAVWPAPHDVIRVDITSGSVLADLVVAGDASGRGRMVSLRMSWSPRDPLSVDLTLTARPDHPALPRGSWVVLRDFLRYGLDTPTGDGDVRIRPDAGTGDGPRLVWLHLARATRPFQVAVPVTILAAFLDRTEDTIPAGSERSEELVEEVLRRLLLS